MGRVQEDRESLLSDWPFDMPADWIEWVNAAQAEMEIEALRKCVNRGTSSGTGMALSGRKKVTDVSGHPPGVMVPPRVEIRRFD
jgi:hypothetical protein